MWKNSTKGPLINQSASLFLLMLTLSGCSTMSLINNSDAGVQAGKGNETRAPVPKQASKLFQQSIDAMANKQLKKAEKRLLEITDRYPEFASPFTNLGIIYVHNQQQKMAEWAFQQAILIQPDECAAYVQLGLLERRRFNFNKAEQAYLQCLKVNPENSAAHLNLGILYEIYQGRLPEALVAYEKYQSFMLEPDKRVSGWMADLSRRISSSNRIASGGAR
ncbi:MAG: tetratricopeptide repeat protein [bacterium]|nr:hypothetical protein [Gammaproteobacteria bacterium]HIL96708.1 hypothetical protein [Pseudomonadales bacterium]